MGLKHFLLVGGCGLSTSNINGDVGLKSWNVKMCRTKCGLSSNFMHGKNGAFIRKFPPVNRRFNPRRFTYLSDIGFAHLSTSFTSSHEPFFYCFVGHMVTINLSFLFFTPSHSQHRSDLHLKKKNTFQFRNSEEKERIEISAFQLYIFVQKG